MAGRHVEGQMGSGVIVQTVTKRRKSLAHLDFYIYLPGSSDLSIIAAVAIDS